MIFETSHILKQEGNGPIIPASTRAMRNRHVVLYDQSPEFKFRFVFFRLQMLRFSALCGPNEQKFGELLT